MKIKIWGCRGSVAAPLERSGYREKLNRIFRRLTPEDVADHQSKKNFLNSLPFDLRDTFGGNTSCVEVRGEDGTFLVLDTGTGVRPLGLSLMEEFGPKQAKTYHVIYSHTHWDHICGLMFFIPIFLPTNELIFYSKYDNLQERLDIQQMPYFFPINVDYMASTKKYVQIGPDTPLDLGGLHIESLELNHPGNSLGFRITENGKTFVYCTDTEYDYSGRTDSHKYEAFLHEADIVFFDTQYVIKQIHDRLNWGHSTGMTAVDLCLNANVKSLIMFHHEPTNTDHDLFDNCVNLVKYKHIKDASSRLNIQPGFEGQTFTL